MQRLVFYHDNLFSVRDGSGKWHNLLDSYDVKQVATRAEIREAIRDDENAQYPLPEYSPETGLYYWPPDQEDQYTEEDIMADLEMIGWATDLIAPLLELARICAKYGVKE